MQMRHTERSAQRDRDERRRARAGGVRSQPSVERTIHSKLGDNTQWILHAQQQDHDEDVVSADTDLEPHTRRKMQSRFDADEWPTCARPLVQTTLSERDRSLPPPSPPERMHVDVFHANAKTTLTATFMFRHRPL
jgi:hypothetical protein